MNRGKGGRDVRQAACDHWVERLSDYLDDEMRKAERREAERHLVECESCREVLGELRAVVGRAQAEATPVAPANDLWPGVRARLRPRGVRWVRLSGLRRRSLSAAKARPLVTQRWLAAAALLVLACLAAFSFFKRPESTSGTPGATPRPPAEMRADARAPKEDPAYDDNVAELRRAAGARLTADPQLVKVLDDNLSSLDRAIAEYEDALAAQPGDQELKLRLDEAKRRKLEVLQHAAGQTVEGNN